MSGGSLHLTAPDFLMEETAFSLSPGYRDLMITNGNLIIRQALIPVVSFMSPLKFRAYFTLLPIWCQLVQILICTWERSCLCSSRPSLYLSKACILSLVEVMTVTVGGVSSRQSGGTDHPGLQPIKLRQ